MKSPRNPNRRPTHPGAVLREDVLPGLDVTPFKPGLLAAEGYLYPVPYQGGGGQFKKRY